VSGNIWNITRSERDGVALLCAAAALKSLAPERMRLPVDLRVPALAASNAMSGMLCGLLVMGATVVMPPAVEAKTDGAAIGKCLFKSCQLPLARCVTDPTCAANLLCIQTCNDRDDEGDCQIRCGDAFTNDVVADFTKWWALAATQPRRRGRAWPRAAAVQPAWRCSSLARAARSAVSDKSCVPQRQDDGSWPVPQSSALVKEVRALPLSAHPLRSPSPPTRSAHPLRPTAPLKPEAVHEARAPLLS
jgi:hypothetical protein